jgi:hypothetical protein
LKFQIRNSAVEVCDATAAGLCTTAGYQTCLEFNMDEFSSFLQEFEYFLRFCAGFSVTLVSNQNYHA